MPNNYIVGISGLQGSGKTALSTALGYAYFLLGRDVYCNYRLNFEYKPIDSLDDIKKVRNGVLILDEIWLFLFSRTSQKTLNQELMKIIMLNRKRNVDIIYTAQLKRTVDVLLRNVTNYFLSPKLFKRICLVDGEKVDRFFIGYLIQNIRGDVIEHKEINLSIDQIGQLFNTYEEVSNLENKPSPLDVGIGLENDFAKAIGKFSFVKHVDVLPNSGHGSSWLFDVIVYLPKHVMAVDVKGASSHVFINRFGADLRKQIRNAYDHNAVPCLAFPVGGCKRLTSLNSWYLYKLTNNSYVTNLRSNPRYDKLAKNSILLKEFDVTGG